MEGTPGTMSELPDVTADTLQGFVERIPTLPRDHSIYAIRTDDGWRPDTPAILVGPFRGVFQRDIRVASRQHAE